MEAFAYEEFVDRFNNELQIGTVYFFKEFVVWASGTAITHRLSHTVKFYYHFTWANWDTPTYGTHKCPSPTDAVHGF